MNSNRSGGEDRGEVLLKHLEETWLFHSLSVTTLRGQTLWFSVAAGDTMADGQDSTQQLPSHIIQDEGNRTDGRWVSGMKTSSEPMARWDLACLLGLGRDSP